MECDSNVETKFDIKKSLLDNNNNIIIRNLFVHLFIY